MNTFAACSASRSASLAAESEPPTTATTFLFIERPVAERAVMNPLVAELVVAGDLQFAVSRAGGQQQR
jgi:hypothetical protein